MRATDGLQTTITHRPVNVIDQKFALELSLGMTLPIPPQDEHLPDQIEAYVHQAGLELQRRLFQLLIEKADQELVLQQRHGKGGAGIQRKGTRPFTFNCQFAEYLYRLCGIFCWKNRGFRGEGGDAAASGGIMAG